MQKKSRMSERGVTLVSTLLGLSLAGVFSGLVFATMHSIALQTKQELDKRVMEHSENTVLAGVSSVVRRAYNPFFETINVDSPHSVTLILPEYEKIHAVISPGTFCGQASDAEYWLFLDYESVNLVRTRPKREPNATGCSAVTGSFPEAAEDVVFAFPVHSVSQLVFEEQELRLISKLNSDSQVLAENLSSFKVIKDGRRVVVEAGGAKIQLDYSNVSNYWEIFY